MYETVPELGNNGIFLQTDELLVLSTTQNLANYYIQLLSCNEKITWSPQNCNGAGQHSINPWMFLSHRVRHRGEMKKRNSALKKLRKKRQASADLLQQLRTQRIVSLNSNTRFVSNQNPIEINADLFVPAGITLQIEDGVELRFAAGRKLTVQGNKKKFMAGLAQQFSNFLNASMYKMYVRVCTVGTLVASGTIANPIMMKPSSTSARWNGLRLETPHNAYGIRFIIDLHGIKEECDIYV